MSQTAIMPDERAGVDLAKVWLPGFHYGVPFEEYARLPYLNASTLVWGNSSAQHLKSALDGKLGHGDSTDRLFGRALHARLLEPSVYTREYVIAPGCQAKLQGGRSKGMACGKTAKYIVKGEWLCGIHMPKELTQIIDPISNVLTIEQAQRIEMAAKAVERDPIVKLLRLPNGGYEATVLFEWDGVKCKARLDKWITRSNVSPPVIIDLKKTQVGRASDEAVERACFEYLYDAKAAFYMRAVETVELDKPIFIWVYIEDGEPFGLNIIQADDETLMAGRRRIDMCWSAYRRGMHSGVWPGYMLDAHAPKMGGLSSWAKEKILGRNRRF